MIHCLHGSAGCHSNWDSFENSFGEAINKIDLWSLLESKKKIPLHEAGRLVAEQADHGDFLLGYSMGGRIALHSLIDYPDRWRGAIIIAANPGLTDGRAERIARDERWAQVAQTNWQNFLKKWNNQALFDSTRDNLPNFRQAPEHQSAQVARSFREWSLGRQSDLHPDLSKINCPVLWLTGAQDEKFCAIARDAVSQIPRGRLNVIPNAGHRLPWQQPELFSEIVKDFIELSNPF